MSVIFEKSIDMVSMAQSETNKRKKKIILGSTKGGRKTEEEPRMMRWVDDADGEREREKNRIQKAEAKRSCLTLVFCQKKVKWSWGENLHFVFCNRLIRVVCGKIVGRIEVVDRVEIVGYIFKFENTTSSTLI